MRLQICKTACLKCPFRLLNGCISASLLVDTELMENHDKLLFTCVPFQQQVFHNHFHHILLPLPCVLWRRRVSFNGLHL